MTISLTLERDQLLSAIQKVIGSVNKRSTIEVTQHIVITPQDGEIRLLATNLDMQATTTCPAIGSGPAFTLPGQMILDMLNNWPAGSQVAMTRDDKDPRIIVKCGRSRFKVPTLNPNDVPELKAPEGESVTVRQDALASAIGGAFYAVSKDQTRFFMTGVYAHMDGSVLKLVATDNKRVAVSWAEVEGETGTAILAPGFVSEMLRLLGSQETAELTISKTMAKFVAGETVITAKVIDSDYVDYVRAIPPVREHALTVDRDALLSAVRQAQIVATDKSRGIRLVIKSDGLNVVARNQETGEGDCEIEAEWNGPDTEIPINSANLMDVINNFDVDALTIQYAGPRSPVVIEGHNRLASVSLLRG